MCKITETVSEVNQIRTEKTRPHSGISPVTMETIMEIDRRRTETSYVTILSLYLLVSSSHSSSLLYSILLSICLYISQALSLLCLMSQISIFLFFSLPLSPSHSFSVFVVVHRVYVLKSNTCSLCKETFYCFALGLYLILWPLRRLLFLLFLSSSFSLFIQLKQCDSTVLMQHHANCQKPSGEHSPTLEYSAESNLAGVTEVRLECSHFSTGIILFMLMASQLRPTK